MQEQPKPSPYAVQVDISHRWEIYIWFTMIFTISIYTVYTVSKVHVTCYLSCPASVLGILFMFTRSQNQASLRVLWHYLSQIQFSFRSIAWVPYCHWTGEAVNEETHKTKPEAHKECRTRSGLEKHNRKHWIAECGDKLNQDWLRDGRHKSTTDFSFHTCMKSNRTTAGSMRKRELLKHHV